MSSLNSYVLIAISNMNRAASFRHVVVDLLRLEATIVRDGDDALQEISRRGVPALLIVDLSLPRVDGFTVVRKVRRQAPEANVRVVVVAAHESLRAAARALSASLGISSILPLDVDEASLKDILSVESKAMMGASVPGLSAMAPTVLRSPHLSSAGDVMDRAAIEARRRFGMPICVGYIRIGEQEHLMFQVTGRDAEPARALSEISDVAFLRQIADAGDPLVIPTIEDHPVFAQHLSKGSRSVRGFAAVPIAITRSDARAALCVLDVKPVTLSAGDMDALATFGRSVGVEIDRLLNPRATDTTPLDINAEDVKALQHLASTDPLTGLANRRGGEKHIANEISRAKRERRPLSCILLDIDRFKQVNDTFGHQAGDQLLRDISALLRRNMRAYDILVRWGGEEFLLVLPGVDLDAARMLAERVRVAIEALDTHGIGPVTISAGAAKFESDYDFAATLKTADQRLYQAKTSGRNKII
jgi:diguanylate cyclase (GGDEF)-like protein